MATLFVSVKEAIPLGAHGMHFPEIGDQGVCGKRVQEGKSGSKVPCREPRNAPCHLFYPCRVALRCAHRAPSVDMLIEHEEKCRGRA